MEEKATGGRYIDRKPPENSEELLDYLNYLVDQLNYIFSYYGKHIKAIEDKMQAP